MAHRKFRIAHYLNQFFGQIGGEDKAGTEPVALSGAVGPGLAFSQAFGDKAEIVGTVICGDSYFTEQIEEAQARVTQLIEGFRPDAVIAGPAFNAGRYGVACGAVAKSVSARLRVPVITGMYEENPGLDLYGKYAYVVPTGPSAAAMRKAVPAMASLALRLAAGEALGTPAEEGYRPRGIRRNVFSSRRGSARALAMLLKKLNGEPLATEYPMPVFDRVTPRPAIKDLSHATIALVTSGGIVPRGNPDRIESSSASRYGRYSLENLTDLDTEHFQTAHGGYDPVYANQDADRVLPVDVLRELEAEGVIGHLHDYYYSTVGNGTSVADSARYAREIAEDLRDKADAVILTST